MKFIHPKYINLIFFLLLLFLFLCWHYSLW